MLCNVGLLTAIVLAVWIHWKNIIEEYVGNRLVGCIGLANNLIDSIRRVRQLDVRAIRLETARKLRGNCEETLEKL